MDSVQCRTLKAKLLSIMDTEKDRLRFYEVGSHYEKKIKHYGVERTYLVENP